MSAIAIIIAAVAAGIALYGSRGGQMPRALALITVLMITAQLLLVEQSLGPVPVRVLIFGVAVIYLIYDLLGPRSCLRTSDERFLFLLWSLFAAGVFAAQWLNGAISGSEEIVDFVSRYGFSLVLFALVAGMARAPRGAFLIAGWLFSIAAANFAFVMAQLLMVPGAIEVHAQLFPQIKAREAALIAEGLITTFGYLPGLSSYSIVTGYVLTCFAVLGVALGEHRAPAFRLIMCAAAAVIAVVGGAMILSRSTILVGSLACFAALVWTTRSSVGRVTILWSSAIAGLVLVTLSVAILGAAAENIPGFHRVQTLQDSARLRIYANAVHFFAEHPFIGGSPADRVAAGITVGAHNFILNAAANFGLIGTIPMIGLILATLVKGRQAVRSAVGTPVHSLVICGYVCMFAYLLKGLFHNESVATSGILYAMLAGLTVGAAANMRQVTRLPKRARRSAATSAT